MKANRHNKVLGLAIGERSLMAAEVVSGSAAGEAEVRKPQVTHLAELVYPEGVSYLTPEALGKALGDFLRENKFTARTAVIGLPAKWLVVKPKEVPPTDRATLADMLRLQAEGEFSTELKDLVYDYASGADDENAPVHPDMASTDDQVTTLTPTRTVLLIATPRRYVNAAGVMCDAARLTPAAVMPSSIALGAATGRTTKRNSLVLTVTSWGAELTAQRRDVPQAIRTLRPPAADGPFVGDLRRAVSSIPPTPGGPTKRELVMWGGSNASPMPDADSLSKSLGISVRCGELPTLGVDVPEAGSNGQGRQYAPAVALALSVIVPPEPAVDFLHTRLAPPAERRIPRWALSAALALVAILALVYFCYNYLQQKTAAVEDLRRQVDENTPTVAVAQDFVNRVTFAQRFYGKNPRYLACVRDLTVAIPEDMQTYCTGLVLRQITKPPIGASTGTNVKPVDLNTITGVFTGRTTNQQGALSVLDHLKRIPAFSKVDLPSTADAGRTREIQFTITFDYLEPAHVAGTAPSSAEKR